MVGRGAAEPETLKESIWRLAAEGFTSIEIYDRLRHTGTTRRAVISRVSEFRRAGGLAGRAARAPHRPAGALLLQIDRDTRDALDLEASDRGTTTADLVVTLLDTIATQDGFDRLLPAKPLGLLEFSGAREEQ